MEDLKKPEQPITPPAQAPETCKACNKQIAQGQASFVNDVPFCNNCREKVMDELHAQEATGPEIVPAVLGALAAAIVAGVAWGLIVILTNHEIGYVAIGVGILAGYAVYWASGKKRGMQLQLIASAASIVGILIGKYISFYHFYTQMVEGYIKNNPEKFSSPASEIMKKFSIFNGDIISDFFANIGNMVSGFDILWVILAIGAAYKIPRLIKVQFTGSKQGLTGASK